MAETPARKDTQDKTRGQTDEGTRKQTEAGDKAAGGTVLIDKKQGGRSL